MKKTNDREKYNRIVVFGGNGFIGSHFAKICSANGFKNIVIADVKKQKQTVDNIKYQICNLKNNKTIYHLLKKNDIVCHFACSSFPQSSENHIEQDLGQNLFGTIQLLKACAAKKIQKFIFLSSGGTVYGNIPKSLQVRENAELNPICAHGLMKICCEKYIKYFANKFKFKYLILRVANPYGRIYNKKRPQGIIDHVLFSAINNRPINIWGSLDKTRDFIYIDDLCELLLLAVKKQVKSSCFNVGSGSSKSLRSIIKLIQITCRRKIKLRVLKERSIDVKYNQLNISKTKKYFNWTPLININRGIKKLYNQYFENINNYNNI